MRRIYKILRLRGEAISWRGREGKLRWWIRDVVKLTFVACKQCGIELEKIDRSAMSVWHAQKVKLFQPEQYVIEEQTLFSIERSMPKFLGREWKSPGLKQQPSDTPPLSLNALFQDLFESLSDLLARIIK
jgi:Zn ribbon nucleic-acid-binding protein